MSAGIHFYREPEVKLHVGMVEPIGVFCALDTEGKLSDENTRARQ